MRPVGLLSASAIRLLNVGLALVCIFLLLSPAVRADTTPEMGQLVEDGRFAALLKAGADGLSGRLQSLAASARALSAELDYAALVLGLELSPGELSSILLQGLILFALGLGAERIFLRLTRRRPAIGRRLAPLVFFGVSFGSYGVLQWPPLLELLLLTLLSSLAILRMIRRLFRAALKDHRLQGITAGLLFWSIANTLLLESAVHEAGLLPESRLFLRTLLLIMPVLLLTLLVAVRPAVWQPVLGRFWHLPHSAPIAYRLTLTALPLLALAILLGLRPVGMLLVGAAAVMLADHGTCALFPPPDPQRRLSYLPLIRRAARLMIALSVFSLVVRFGIGVRVMNGMGALWVPKLIQAGLIAFLADMAFQVLRLAVERKLHSLRPPPGQEGMDEPGGEAGPHARTLTLLPLFRMAGGILILSIAVLTILSSLDVDIAPLLAGAGVFGLALGFGAQALVRDIVSGIFFLIDDAFRVGEYIEVGNLRGTVERITLRSLQLRHHRGALNTLPFGEIKAIVNQSRDWVLVRLEFRLPFDTDVEKVRRIVKRIGQEMMQDPELAPSFLEPLKSQGIRAWEEYGMVVGVKFIARPGTQFVIQRLAYARIRDALQDAGIRFATRRVAVEVAGASAPGVEQAALAAAAEATLNGPDKKPA